MTAKKKKYTMLRLVARIQAGELTQDQAVGLIQEAVNRTLESNPDEILGHLDKLVAPEPR